jgi:PIN domain nuclease of toxin-antitoxin system
VRLLLDTHAMYWYIEDDPQLSGPARTLIQDASNEILISPASFWEIAVKISIGKWRMNRPFEEFIDIGLSHVTGRYLSTTASGDDLTPAAPLLRMAVLYRIEAPQWVGQRGNGRRR